MVRKRWIIFAGFVARMEKKRLLKHVIFGEIEDVVDVTILNGKREDWVRCALEDMTKFDANQDGWTTKAV